MAYKIDSAWERGQTITAERLNHMENGIAAALGAIGDAFGKEYTDGSREYTVGLDKLSNKPIDAGAITGTTLKATDTESENALDIAGVSALKGNVNIGGALTVGQNETGKTKDTTLNGKLIVTGKDVQVDSSTVKQAANFTGTLDVSGTTTVTGDTILKGNLTVGSETAADKKAIKLNDTVKIDTDSSNHVIIEGQTQINAPVIIGNDKNYYGVSIYGIPTVYGQTLTIATLGRQAMIKLATDGKITAKKLVIGTASSQTAEATGLTELYGTTMIDKLNKLIVGDSTTTVENEIYGFTTISNLTASQLVVGKAADEENEQAATGSTSLHGTTNIDNLIVGNIAVDNDTIIYTGTTAFNTTVNILHGTTTIDKLDKIIVGDADTASNIENKIYGTTTIYNTLQIGTYGVQDFWPNPEAPRIEQFGVQGTLKIFSNIQIGLTGDEEGRGTRELVNTNIRIHGNTAIDNLTIKDELALTNGTDTVTLTIEDLQQLKDLLTESNGGETP